jgi:hypothetical protein
MARPPVVKSFLIADQVLQDRLSGKWSVIGIFDRILAPQFPVMHPTVSIYLKLGDALGKYRFRVEFRDAEDRRLGAFDGGAFEVLERTGDVEVGLPTHLLPIEKPGRYQFQLFLNDEFAASAELRAVQMDRPPAPPTT